MWFEALEPYPRRPPSEFEWEDLLVRFELMPRALRVALEHVTTRDARLAPLLDGLLEREQGARDFIEQAAGANDRDTAVAADAQIHAREADALDRFVRLRSRNFAMLQRRGIDVWDWEAPVGSRGSATIHQILTFLSQKDVETLAAIRDVTTGAGRAC